MNREDIIKLAREQGLPETETEGVFRVNTDDLGRMLAAEREKVATWMMRQGYATGHGDTVEDLLKELEWQIREREHEVCAKVCEEELHLQAAGYANRRMEAYLDYVKRGLAEKISKKMVDWIWVAHYEGWRDAIQEKNDGH